MQHATQRKMGIVTGLRHALEHNELRLVYQPQIDLETRKMVCVEALLRWNDPNDGVVMPKDFLPIAEDSGLILPLTDWVLKAALKDIKTWSNAGLAIRVAVNVSPRVCKSTLDFGKLVGRLIVEHGVDPTLIEFELTENLLLDDVDEAVKLFHYIKDMGSHVSIDDFGIGYSSMSYLKKLPIDKLKIDQSFIQNIENGSGDMAITAHWPWPRAQFMCTRRGR